MKKIKLSKVLMLVLSLVLLIGAATVMVSGAAEAETKPVILSKNIQYGGDFSLMIAVDASTVAEGEVTLDLTFTDSKGVEQKRTYTDSTTEPIKVNNVDYQAYVFYTEGVAAKEMKTQYYLQATDSTGAKSDVVRYSVAEYMYERLYGGKTITTEQKDLYEVVLDFGAKAQKVLNTADTKYVTDYYFARVAEGTVDGTYSQGVFHKDDAQSFTLGTYTGAVPEFHTLNGWTVTKTAADGTVTATSAAVGATVTVDAHTVVTPNFKKQSIDFEDKAVTTSGAVWTPASGVTGQGIDNTNCVSSNIVTSPTEENASNKAVETVVKSNVYAGNCGVGHKLTVNGDSGNTYILDLNIKYASVTGIFSRIYFASGFTGEYVELSNWENDSLASVGSATNALPLNDWANIRLEVYNIYDGDSYSETKIKVIVDGEYKGEITKTTELSLTHFTIRYGSGAGSTENATITIDDIMAVRCDLEYKAD